MWELYYMESECPRIDAFELRCWRRLLRVPWSARRSNQSILKEISPGCSLVGLILKLKLQYSGHLMQRADSPDAERDWGQEEKATAEDEMVGWHLRLNGHGFGWTLGVGDGQGGLAWCSSWNCKESDTTEQLNWTDPVCNGIPYDVQGRHEVTESDIPEWLNWTDDGIINIWFPPNWNQTKMLSWPLCLCGWTHCWPLPSSVCIKYLIH